jgi:hypothetical protein
MTTFWMLFIPLSAILLPLWVGQKHGSHTKKKSPGISEAPFGAAVGATLGLLAFMLGFTFQVVGNRFDKRKEFLMNEVAAIRTAYLYAGLVPEPLRSGSRELLVNYTDIRVEIRQDPSKLQEGILRSRRILDSLWHFSETLAVQDRSSEAYALYMSSISALVVLFDERLTITFQFHLHPVILCVLGIIGFVSMYLLGYHLGMSGKISRWAMFLFGITFAGILWLIFALDRPEQGLIQISDAPFKALQQQLHR